MVDYAKGLRQSDYPSGAGMAGLDLTPQEQNLYQHHLSNVGDQGFVRNPDNSISTLFQMSFEHDGKTYNIPSVWDGKILPPHEALMRALQFGGGWDYWPSYPSEQAASDRYMGQLHDEMAKDIPEVQRSFTGASH